MCILRDTCKYLCSANTKLENKSISVIFSLQFLHFPFMSQQLNTGNLSKKCHLSN